MAENSWPIEITLPPNSQSGLAKKVINALKEIGRLDCTQEDSGEGTTILEKIGNRFFTVIWTEKGEEEVKKEVGNLVSRLGIEIEC